MEQGGSQRQMQDEAGPVRPLQPKVWLSTVSQLSGHEIELRMTEKGSVELDLLRPEKSEWLQGILKETRSPDPVTRFCALWRFKDVFNTAAVAKGAAQSTGFAAFALEQGILEEPLRILQAAQSNGDWYLIPRLLTGFDAISKVGLCFRILHGMMLDARTTRFVRKAFPGLLSLIEGVYLAERVIAAEPAARVLLFTVPASRPEDDKKPALAVLLQLCIWSKQTRPLIGGRKLFLQRVARDCVADSQFARDIIERVVHTFTYLLEACDLFSLADEILDVAFKALEVAQRKEILQAAVHLLQSMMAHFGTAFIEKLSQPTAKAQTRKDYYTSQLLAVATCPGFMLDKRSVLYFYLSIFHPPFRPIMAQSRPGDCTPAQEREVETYLAANPKAIARRRQICQLLAPAAKQAFNQPSGLQAGPMSESATTYVQKPVQNPLGPTPGTASYWEEDKTPQRKCSRSGCSLVESASGRFKVCGGCRLALYCSQDCQRVAWKEGHKARCQSRKSK